MTNNSSTTVFYGPPVTAAPAPFGPATFAMPDLRGLPIARASAVAEQFGLQTSVTGGWTDPGAATAVVVEQYPPAGASVSPGQSVRVMLAHAGGFATTSAPPTTVTAPTTVPTTSTSIP